MELPLHNGHVPNSADLRPADGPRRDVGLFPAQAEDVAYIHHTSGTSSGLPKPIPQRHHGAVAVLPDLGDSRNKATFSTTPLHHGGPADCFRSWSSGAMIWLFPERERPITASNIVKSLRCCEKASESNQTPPVAYFSSVPYVLQMMAHDDQALEYLKKMDIVGVGGASLPDEVGNSLVDRGVNLVSRYGSTECGFLMSSHRDFDSDRAWQYLRDSRLGTLRFVKQEDGLAELVVKSCWPHMVKRNREDGSYATSDLFEPHPQIPDAWRYHSRADAQLTLVNGKKFDPEPLEAAIAASSLISDVLIFGNNQMFPGALLFRTEAAREMKDDDIYDQVWPTIEALNSKSQPHARIQQNMCILMPSHAEGPPKSSKGTVMRRATESMFAVNINNAYGLLRDWEEMNRREGPLPERQMQMAVQNSIKRAMHIEEWVDEDLDLYSLGVDSIACMQIKDSLEVILHLPSLPFNVVYDQGTVRNLTKYLLDFQHGKIGPKEDLSDQMNCLVAEYSRFFGVIRFEEDQPKRSDHCHKSKPSGEIVVLTGATGALGAHILDQLRSDSRISEIHCLVRAASVHAANERVSKSLTARGKAPIQSLGSKKIIAHPCKLAEHFLGLNSDMDERGLYYDLVDSTTIIIHAAWAVNFSMRLSSFAKDHINGLRNLINFALASQKAVPPRFFFCSSTASVLGPEGTSPIPERVSHDPLTASPLGYAQSKWVGEAICEQAHLISRLCNRIAVIRVGQLCGDTQNGIWNKTEAWPIMLSTGPVLDALPALNEKLAWLPVDIAARAVIEAALGSALQGPDGEWMPPIPVYHVLNPHNGPDWHEMIGWIREVSPNIQTLPPKAWLSKFENDLQYPHPAFKLEGLWQNAYGDGNEAGKPIVYDMRTTMDALTVMQKVQPVSKEAFLKMWSWINKEMVQKS